MTMPRLSADSGDPTASSTASSIASSITDYDTFDPEHTRAKYAYFKQSQDQCPVRYTAVNGGLWLVTRYEDVRAVLDDWRTFSSVSAPIVQSGAGTPKLFPLTYDPPIQTQVRELLNPLFSRAAVRAYEDPMRRSARALIAGWRDRGTVEILSEFARPYIGTLLTAIIFSGMSQQDMDRAQDLVHESAEHTSEALFAEISRAAEAYLPTARKLSLPAGTVVGRLLSAQIDGRPITDEEVTSGLMLLLLGGLGTTQAAIGSIAYRVSTTPGLESRLRDKQWVRRDLDEFLRLDAPVSCMARTATRDVELGGVKIRAGERVQIQYDAANHDERRFARPAELVLDEPRPGHMSFGSGVHRCVGSHLARLQIEVAFDELLAQIRDIRLAPGAEPAWVPGVDNCLHEVPIEFDLAG
jgi:cytochrome P450